ncbi:MAG: AraC family transcriptional regulator [Sneathiella sp.]
MDTNDLLSDVFSTLRISSDIYFRTQFSGQYSVFLPTEKRRIRIHVVLRGSCWLCVEGSEPVFLSEGDVALVPNGASQSIKASPTIPPVNLQDLIAAGAIKDQTLQVGEGIETASLLCGFCYFDEEVDHPVTAILPTYIHLRHQDLGSAPWLSATMTLIMLEAKLNSQGTSAILNRLIEIIVVQATRQLALNDKEESKGFLRALSDKALSKALFSIHSHPEEAWRVENLADLAGMSRSNFAKKFLVQIGKTPMEYLRDWRLMRARILLTNTDLSIEEIVAQIGYVSLPSFSKLFKNRFNIGPSAYRRGGGRS